jgi:UDP-glucose 4-epimerase
MIESSLGTPLEREFLAPRVGDVPHSQAASERLLALFPDVEPTSLAVGLQTTIDWFRTLPEYRA